MTPGFVALALTLGATPLDAAAPGWLATQETSSVPAQAPPAPATQAAPPVATPTAQTPAAAGQAPADSALQEAPPPQDGVQAEPQGFTYDAEGRRDPFVSLLLRGSGTVLGIGERPTGLAGLLAAEVTLRGILETSDGFVAMLLGSDQRTYIVRPGDKLLDGTISTITQTDLVILQQVSDPLSLEKEREVRKLLRPTEAN